MDAPSHVFHLKRLALLIREQCTDSKQLVSSLNSEPVANKAKSKKTKSKAKVHKEPREPFKILVESYDTNIFSIWDHLATILTFFWCPWTIY